MIIAQQSDTTMVLKDSGTKGVWAGIAIIVIFALILWFGLENPVPGDTPALVLLGFFIFVGVLLIFTVKWRTATFDKTSGTVTLESHGVIGGGVTQYKLSDITQIKMDRTATVAPTNGVLPWLRTNYRLKIELQNGKSFPLDNMRAQGTTVLWGESKPDMEADIGHQLASFVSVPYIEGSMFQN